MRNHLILGNWNSLCDRCGRKFKASELMKDWQGLMVCKEDYELRHPSDFLRTQREKIAVPWSRPYPAQDEFLPGPQCTVFSMVAKADQATADCARADLNIPVGTYDEFTNFIFADTATALADDAYADFARSDKSKSLSPTY